MSRSSVVRFSKRTEANELASMIRMLPPLPEVAHKILVQFNNEFVSGNEIADIVECDPAISARLFALANSAYFGLEKPVTEMREVVSRVLGPDTVRSLAFALATEQTFDLSQCANFESRRFWQRSLHCASAAQRIAAVIEDIKTEVKDFSYLAGLCHSLGILALACCYPKETSQIFEEHDSDDSADLEHLCSEQFGFCIDDVTYELALHWDMPVSIVEAYRCRASKDAANNLLAAILNASIKSAKYSEQCASQSDVSAIEAPDFDEDLPYVEADILATASLGSDAQRMATQSRLQAMIS